MLLNWSKSWTDFIQTATGIYSLCEKKLSLLPPNQRSRSSEVLARAQMQLKTSVNDIRRSPHIWGTQLANVGVRILRCIPLTNADERQSARQLSNYCALVFDFRRNSDPTGAFEGNFRDSLECFLKASLPDVVSSAIAADAVDEVNALLKAYYERVPRDLLFLMHDAVLRAYEDQRRKLDTKETRGLMTRFVEDNRDLIKLQVSTTCEPIRLHWESFYRNHIGEPPAAPGQRALTRDVRIRLKEAIQNNDPMGVRDVLAPLEAGLIGAVKAGLDISFDFREPARSVRDYSRKPSADFETARRQIRMNSQRAVASFSQLWRSQPQNSFAKEWYAYAVAKLDGGWRQAKNIFEEIKAADRADQTTDWNLACCEIKLGDRKSAFRILRERMESGTDLDNILEATIALALEFKEKKFLSEQLDWLPVDEAIALGYLFGADSHAPIDELEERLSSIEVIASDAQGFEPPDPAERMTPQDLNDLRFRFIQRRMVRGGITWFRRRLSFDEHKYFYLNWRLLGDLCLEARQFAEAVSAYDRMLFQSNRPQVAVETKQMALEEILSILLDHNRNSDAGVLLKKYANMLSAPELTRWEQLVRPPEPAVETSSLPTRQVEKATTPEPEEGPHPTGGGEARFMEVLVRLPEIRRLEDLKGNFKLLIDGADSLFEIWPAHSRKLVEQIRTTIKCLQDFDKTSNVEDKEKLGTALRDGMAQINSLMKEILEPELRKQAESLTKALGRLAEDASFQTNATRNIEIDWRLNAYLPNRTLLPVSPDVPKTSLLLRILNRGTEPINDVGVFLQSESGKVQVVKSPQRPDSVIAAGDSAVLRFPLEYDSVAGDETFLSHVKFSSGGVTNLQTPARRFTIPADSFSSRLGGDEQIRDAFFVGLGIPDERRDVFRGREREQKRIANSLRGNVQPEVLFLNGPRRVGKTSILNSLRWALPELGLTEIITVPLPEEIPQTTAAYLRGIASEICKSVKNHLNVEGVLEIPTAEEFEREPTVTFRRFCDHAQERLAPRRIVLMIDETQRLAQAVKSGRIDDNVLGLFSTLMSRNSGVMFVFTASVLFRNVKDLSQNPVWGRLTQYTMGFLNADAVSQVLEAGVAPYAVKFTPEAVRRVWQMTEGHPWVVQAIGKRIVSEVLNPQQRLVVCPADVDQAVEFIEKTEDQYSYYWWNERVEEGGFVDEIDWDIAAAVIEGQEGPGGGVTKTELFQKMAKNGGSISNERINKLCDMQTLVRDSRNGEEVIRIKGLFLERWLRSQIEARNTRSVKALAAVSNVALFVDHENVRISMQKFIDELPTSKQTAWAPIRDAALLARRLTQRAEKYGPLACRVAVANWPLFSQDLSGYAQAMFDFSQPLGGKNTSDERLKQMIRDTLEQKPEIQTYVLGTGDADFRDTIHTLLKRNKRVVLWGFRAIGSIKSNVSSVFREMESWQNLTIEYLNDILLEDIEVKKTTATG